MKYIVKNCGCNPSCDECYINCANIDNCLTKQVINKCKEQTQYCEECASWCCEDCNFNTNGFADDILQLFEIEECKE